jgi:proteasome lid subunit RPN8/RPN11
MHKWQLKFPRGIWLSCMEQLNRRGRGLHESGCFVLGTIAGEKRLATRCVYYDELDPAAYKSGVCMLDGNSFQKLWELCRAEGLSVVADIHTHERAAFQSEADRRNPMIARVGHIALIVPEFAEGAIWRHKLGLFRYLGDHRWSDFSGWQARKYLKVRWTWK